MQILEMVKKNLAFMFAVVRVFHDSDTHGRSVQYDPHLRLRVGLLDLKQAARLSRKHCLVVLLDLCVLI